MEVVNLSNGASVPVKDETDFVTVVSVGQQQNVTAFENVLDKANDQSFVTVLTIGDQLNQAASSETVEEILVYRLPGERLGFGLKFEGGTKTSEYVRRLFIQSCAPDSPASRVRSSWGPLSEGDEIMQIDSIPVKNMTRIDCVRCLKDSNVVIKLLVKHFNQVPDEYLQENTTRSTENLPLVVSAEKKRVPPPPPPIPPRKVPRKMLAKEGAAQPRGQPGDGEAPSSDTKPVAPARQATPHNTDVEHSFKMTSSTNVKGHGVHWRQPPSPNAVVRARQYADTPLPKASARDRRLSDGSGGPPDAEIYLDLISHELEYGFKTESESDDTGSTISTIVDKHHSIPTTSNSSFSEIRTSDSIPSTPTAIQKQMDLTKVLNPFEILEMEFAPSTQPTDDYLFSKLVSSQDAQRERNAANPQSRKNSDNEETPLQPPANFQDAPLSYGTEDVSAMMKQNPTMCNNNDNNSGSCDSWPDVDSDATDNRIKVDVINSVNDAFITADSTKHNGREMEETQLPKPTPRKCYTKKQPPPPPPPIAQDRTKPQDDPDWKVDECEKPNLPRLVNFVPKTPPKDLPITESLDVKTFLENGILNANECNYQDNSDGNDDCPDEANDDVHDDGNDYSYLSLDVVSMEKISDFREVVDGCENNECEEMVIKDVEEESYFNYKWCSSSHLATIGEDEEEFASSDFIPQRSGNTPIVIVQSADQEVGQAKTESDNELDTITDEELIKSDNDNKSDEAGEYNQLNGFDSRMKNAKWDVSEPECDGEIPNNEVALREKAIREITKQRLFQSDIDGTMDASTDAASRQPAFLTPSEHSSQSSPPPSFSRLPPDGHEFPPNYEEPRFEQSGNMNNSDAKRLPPLPKHGPPLVGSRGKLSSQSSESDEVFSENNDSHRASVHSPFFKESKHTTSSSPVVHPPWLKQEKVGAEVTRPTYTSESSVKATLSLGRRKDDRSVGSVKDKIAIFSSSSDSEPLFPQLLASESKLTKTFKSSEDVFRGSENFTKAKRLSKSTVSVDKIAGGKNEGYSLSINSDYKELSRSASNTDVAKTNDCENKQFPIPKFVHSNKSQSSMELSSATANANLTKPSPQNQFSTLPKSLGPCKQEETSSVLGRAFSFSGGSQPLLQTRSQSVLSLGNAGASSRIVGAPSAYGRLDDNSSRRMTLNSLIEQRRRGMSKLRGLVIPEKTTEAATTQSIIDLPEIKSKEAASLNVPSTFATNESKNLTQSNGHQRNHSTSHLTSPPWKSKTSTSTLPEYSPAFKRKSLQLYPTTNSTAFNAVTKCENDQTKSAAQNDKYNFVIDEQNLSPASYDKLIKPNIREMNNYSSQYKLSITETPKSLSLNDAPKSLESITSPARSDCSFDYTSNSPDLRRSTMDPLKGEHNLKSNMLHIETHHFYIDNVTPSLNTHKGELGRSEDESDNDSAVSSSQSSYISRGCSPLLSPLQDASLHYCGTNANMLMSPNSSLSSSDDISSHGKIKERKTYSSETTISISRMPNDPNMQSNCDGLNSRVLKAQSVEAINRKNILASAKCRSGRDLKVGSPLIKRKFDENENDDGCFVKPDVNKCTDKTTDFMLCKDDNLSCEESERSDEGLQFNIIPGKLEDESNKNSRDDFVENDHDSIDNGFVTSEHEKSSSSSLNSSDLIGITSQPSVLEHQNAISDIKYSYSKTRCPSKNDETGECTKIAESSRKVSSSDSDNDQTQHSQVSKFHLHKSTNSDDNCNIQAEIKSPRIASVNKLSDSAKKHTYRDSILNGHKDTKSTYLPKYDTNKRDSVTNIRKTFEKNIPLPKPNQGSNTKSSYKSNPPISPKTPPVVSTVKDIANGVESFTKEAAKNLNSINSEIKHSVIETLSAQDLLHLITEANQNTDDEGKKSSSVDAKDVIVVILHRETAGGSVGITLTGGTDYEAKAITVHKVLNGSPAHKDGRLQKGDRILSINGKSMHGLTHRESIDILKAPRSEVSLVVSPSQKDTSLPTSASKQKDSNTLQPNNGAIDSNTVVPDSLKKSQPVKVMLTKDGAGLGFSLDGGYDSPLGDKPLIIKKIFTGGAAEKCGELHAGDELLGVNNLDVMKMSRIEVWGLMKKLPEGNVTLTIRRRIP